MNKRWRQRLKHEESGFTILEILLAIVITAFIALVILKTTENASRALTRTADEVNSNLEVMNFSHTLRFDVAGSYDLYAYGTSAPNSAYLNSIKTGLSPTVTTLCSSWNGTDTQWDLNQSTAVVRSLFSIKEKYIAPLASAAESSNFFIQPTTVWYGYEIRRAAVVSGQTLPRYQLWRVQCSADSITGGVTGSAGQDKLLVNLGTSLSGFSELSGGTSPISGGAGSLETPTVCLAANAPANTVRSSSCANVLLDCVQENGEDDACPINGSSLKYAYYRFVLPSFETSTSNSTGQYHVTQKLFSDVNNPLLGVIKRRIVGV